MDRPIYVMLVFALFVGSGLWMSHKNIGVSGEISGDSLPISEKTTNTVAETLSVQHPVAPYEKTPEDSGEVAVCDEIAEPVTAEKPETNISDKEVATTVVPEDLEQDASLPDTVSETTSGNDISENDETVSKENVPAPETVHTEDVVVTDMPDTLMQQPVTEEPSVTSRAVAIDAREYEREPQAPETVSIPEYDWPDYHSRERQEMTPEIAREFPRGKHVPRYVKNNVFGVGEQLTYSIDYGFYHAGTAVLSVLDTESVNGEDSYRVQSQASSNKFISSFYKVRDKVNSFIDVNGLFSRRFEKNLREGGYESDRYVDFYHDRLIALSTKESMKVKEIPLYVQDILSSLYILRTFDLEVGKDESINVYADGKVYPLRIIIHEIETVKVPAGKFTCYKVEPVLKSEGLFRSKGRLFVWLSHDEHKIPVKMTSKIPIGNIGANLESFIQGDVQ